MSTGLKQAFFSAYILLFSACSSTHDGNHLNILQLPGAMVSSGIENAVYGHRRQKVVSYARIHYEVLKKEIRKGSGIHLDTLLRLANIKRSHYGTVKLQLRRDYGVIFHNTQSISEQIMRSYSKLYTPKTGTKQRYGFDYNRVYDIVRNYVDNNFDALRLDVKNGQTNHLAKLASRLNITRRVEREQFIHALTGRYYRLYVDGIVVSVMIHGE